MTQNKTETKQREKTKAKTSHTVRNNAENVIIHSCHGNHWFGFQV